MMPGPRFTAVILVLMLMTTSLVLVAPEGSALSYKATLVGARWKDANINQAYISGANVLTYDRIILLKFSIEEPGWITGLSLSMSYTYATASGPVDVFAVDTSFDSTFATTTWTDAQILALCPEDEHVFQLTKGSEVLSGSGGSHSIWNEAKDHLYIGLALWNVGQNDVSYGINIESVELTVTYETNRPWAPTITSSDGNDTACFMDMYTREMSANESCTWVLESVTPPSGGNGDWLGINSTSGMLFGRPFPMCGPEGIGNYSVSVRADSIAGGLSAWQNFTIEVTSTRNGGSIYQRMGDLEIVSNTPGIYGTGAIYRNASITWDVSSMLYGYDDADELEGYGWELYTVAYVNNESLSLGLSHNDTERTYGVYGKSAMEMLNGTQPILILEARIDVEGSTLYARASDINVSAYYFGITGISVNGASVPLPEYTLRGNLNATFDISTTLDWLELEYGYDVVLYVIESSPNTSYLSWAGGDAWNSSYTIQLTDAYGTYQLSFSMFIYDGTTLLSGTTLQTTMTLRAPYAPSIISTAMTPAYTREAYSFTFEAVDTDLFILQYPVPSWATWDNATGTFTGTPGRKDLGGYMVVVYPYNTTDDMLGDPFYCLFLVRAGSETEGDGGFFGYVFSSIIALLFCVFLAMSKDGFNATVFMAVVPMALGVLIMAGAMPLWTIMVGLLFYGVLLFRNIGLGDSL